MSECLTKSADRPERAHYGLAVYCARRFFGRGVSREELIGEAEAALLWAAARFDPRRGVRFSTYAIPFVLGALRELCRRAGPMHVPRAEAHILTAVETARGKLNAREGREPTVGELAQAVGVEPGLLGEMLAALGCENIADREGSLLENLSMEIILAEDPDFIFLVYQSADPSVAEAVADEMLRADPAWASLRAVQEGRCYVMDQQLYNLKPNARWGEAYENLADILYPAA